MPTILPTTTIVPTTVAPSSPTTPGNKVLIVVVEFHCVSST